MRNSVKTKYIARLSQLIETGAALQVITETVQEGADINDKPTYRKRQRIPYDEFTQWKTNCLSLLDVIVPASSIHRPSVLRFTNSTNNPSSKAFGVPFMKAILDDFENGFLDSLHLQIDAELNADFLVQAESLIEHGVAEKAHIPAAVIAGAVLEHGLRSICQSVEPPEPTESKGKRLMMSALIDSLKKRGVYNELTAKQLRAFSDIRNAAAHGDFDAFDPDQVSNMVKGVGSFLAIHLA